MAQQLREMTDLPENWGSIPSSTWGISQSFITPIPRDSMPSSGLYRCFVHVMYRLQAGRTLIHIK